MEIDQLNSHEVTVLSRLSWKRAKGFRGLELETIEIRDFSKGSVNILRISVPHLNRRGWSQRGPARRQGTIKSGSGRAGIAFEWGEGVTGRYNSPGMQEEGGVRLATDSARSRTPGGLRVEHSQLILR